MDIDAKEYQLRCQLRGHEQDARGICICGNAGIATSSRDKTVRFWTLDEPQKRDYSLSKILLGHTSFVGPLAWVPPNEEFPGGGIVSGGIDTLVIVWNLATGEKVKTLKGHKLQVTGVVLDGSDIVSVSVDCTLRRWREGQLVDAWEGHKAAIQAIVKLPTGELVTGSSTDMTLKLWKGKSCMHTFLGHTDTVRGIAAVPDLGILSASHDGSIRLWAVSGELLMEMVGHTSIVYSVDAHISGLIVSGSEDCSAKIWKDGVCIQSIEHPGCVWDTKFLENGDIVTACSDGVVRIWTLNHEKIADDVELNSFFTQLSQYKISRKRVGGMKLEDLPGLDALKTPGSSDGQTKIVREGDNGVAYSWNMREQKWDKIGEVVDGPDDNMSRPLLDGIQYDYVFDVDIGDGEPVRKLPYNRSENPYDVADKWLLNQNLPLSYRQQIVEFIMQNTGQKDFTPDPMFRDPYTGASAYVPGAPSALPGLFDKTNMFSLQKGMLVFDVAQFDGILKKISEFSSVLLSDPEKAHLSMNEVDVSRLNAIVKILKDTSHYHSTTFSDVDVALLLKSESHHTVHMDHEPEINPLLESTYSSSDNTLLDTANFECNICFELAQEPIVTLCGHLYCWPCLYQWLRLHSHSHECPVCKSIVQEEKLVPIFGRGKSNRDPRSRSYTGITIPNRPMGQRPQTAPRVDMNSFVRPNDVDPITGFMPMAVARFGHTTLSTIFGALPAIFNLQVNGFHDATVYGATPYMFSSTFHGGYIHGFHNYHTVPIEWKPIVWKVLFVFLGLLILLHLIIA
ncbi:transducin family protein / WD-40 repeat family protein [Striga hermonthica]|uniref:Transducin family protein / WD-40 repeat family protein n=1 Tax=Striga hermonthica TaxID=68872 RepID=A0A9N7MMC1_STRHE|nr:transducin family protein / WD-40 repeat family protein [Striga hermonthica]